MSKCDDKPQLSQMPSLSRSKTPTAFHKRPQHTYKQVCLTVCLNVFVLVTRATHNPPKHTNAKKMSQSLPTHNNTTTHKPLAEYRSWQCRIAASAEPESQGQKTVRLTSSYQPALANLCNFPFQNTTKRRQYSINKAQFNLKNQTRSFFFHLFKLIFHKKSSWLWEGQNNHVAKK